jgi:hypothetical protein
MTVSPSLARVYASAPADDDYIETLELAHPLFSQSHFVARQPYAFNATLEDARYVTFQPFPFSAQLPAQSGSGQQDLILAIDNVDQSIIAEIELANGDPTTKVSAIYRVFTASNLAAPAFVLPALAMSDIVATDTQVSGTASRTDVLNRPFPSKLYTIALYPGLDR